MNMGFNIAIDGPAGAGKSTIAKKIAAALSFVYVDTGAMYRAIGLYLIRLGIEGTQEEKIATTLSNINVKIEYVSGEQQVILNGENVNSCIRTEEVSQMTSKISVYPAVRQKLLQLQQTMAKESDVIMDGRDIGTCVLPNADVKIYLTADPVVRAKRRFLELTQKGMDCQLEDIERDIRERDHRDMTREVAPLKKAEDAIEVNTSTLTIDEVVERIVTIIREKRG